MSGYAAAPIHTTCPPRSLDQIIAEAIFKLGPFEPQPHLAVAVSGGADSLCLTLLADAYARAQGGTITAITVDHGLRAESATEATNVGEFLHARGIAHMILTPAHTRASNNRLNAARQWRYDALAEWCTSHHVLHCLLAHHADDQAETQLLHRARGNTADGASGMRSVRNYRGVRFLRPLLQVQKSELQTYLIERGVTWIEDPSNSDLRTARARLRAQAQPKRILTDAARSERARRECLLAEAMVECVTLPETGVVELALEIWRRMPTSCATQLVADVIRTVGEKSTRPRQYQTLALCAALNEERDIKRTLGGCVIETCGSRAVFTRENAAVCTTFSPAKPLAASPFW